MASNPFDHGPDRHPDPFQAHSERTNVPGPSAFTPRTGRSQLAADFQPSQYSVICGKGKDCFNHPGNHHLRMLAGEFVADYSQADKKLSKSAIVTNVINVIRQAGGSFCKYENGVWFEVGDHCAREKISAMFRDMLSTQYRSSAKASAKVKTARRRYRAKQNETQTQH
jgi:hypothetical protein